MFMSHYFEYIGDCEVTVTKSAFVAFCVGDGRKVIVYMNWKRMKVI
jgi:hypothetical protein